MNLYLNVTQGLVVYPKMIEKHLREELPFMASENILMRAVMRAATGRSCTKGCASTAWPPAGR